MGSVADFSAGTEERSVREGAMAKGRGWAAGIRWLEPTERFARRSWQRPRPKPLVR